MLKDHNTPMKVIYIYGVEHSSNENSIVIKPDIDLEVNDGDIFAIMFFKNDRIADKKITVKLTSSIPLQDIFDTSDNELIGRCPVGLDGTVELSDNCFAILRAKICGSELSENGASVNVNVRWTDLSQENDSDIYPPVMEIKVRR